MTYITFVHYAMRARPRELRVCGFANRELDIQIYAKVVEKKIERANREKDVKTTRK